MATALLGSRPTMMTSTMPMLIHPIPQRSGARPDEAYRGNPAEAAVGDGVFDGHFGELYPTTWAYN